MNSTKTSFLAALLLLSAVACKQPSAQHSEEGAATEATHNAAPANTPPPAAELSAADQAAADKALIEKYIMKALCSTAPNLILLTTAISR